MIHELKILPEYFEAVRNRTKTFELRRDDRGFRVGDYLALNEWDGHNHTGRTELVKVMHMLNPSVVMDCEQGFVVMSIDRILDYDSKRAEEGHQ